MDEINRESSRDSFVSKVYLTVFIMIVSTIAVVVFINRTVPQGSNANQNQ